MTGLKDTDKNKEWQFAALLLSGASLAISNGGGPRGWSHGSLWNYANARFDAAVDAPGAKLSPKRSDGCKLSTCIWIYLYNLDKTHICEQALPLPRLIIDQKGKQEASRPHRQQVQHPGLVTSFSALSLVGQLNQDHL